MTVSIDRAASARPVSEWLVLATLVCAFATCYALIGLFRHWHFGSNYDLAIFDQAVWHLSRFETPASTASGYSNVLGDHFYPIITVFAPLYWIYPGPETLLVGQSLLIASSIVPVFLFLRRRLPAGPSYTLAAAYGLFWGLQRAVLLDFHEIAFAPPLIAMSILAMDQRRWTLMWVSAAALMLVKEDLIPFVTALGAYVLWMGHRRIGTTLIAVSVVALVVVLRVIIPSFSAGSPYTAPYVALLQKPWLIPMAFVTPPAKLMTAFLWLAPFTLLPLLSPLAVLIVPFALSRLLSENAGHFGTTFHYSAPLAPILVMSAGDALARTARRVDDAARNRVIGGFSASCLVLCLILPGNLPLWNLFKAGHYATTARHEMGYAALATIPDGMPVTSQGAILPHVTHRDGAYLLQPDRPLADIVIASRDLVPWPFSSYDEIEQLLKDARSKGYTTIFNDDGWVVLRRSTASH